MWSKSDEQTHDLLHDWEQGTEVEETDDKFLLGATIAAVICAVVLTGLAVRAAYDKRSREDDEETVRFRLDL